MDVSIFQFGHDNCQLMAIDKLRNFGKTFWRAIRREFENFAELLFKFVKNFVKYAAFLQNLWKIHLKNWFLKINKKKSFNGFNEKNVFFQRFFAIISIFSSNG